MLNLFIIEKDLCMQLSTHPQPYHFIIVTYLYSDLTCRKDTPSMEGGWEERSCDSDTSPNFNLTAPRSQDETEAANMLSKNYHLCMTDNAFYLAVVMY